MVRGLEWYANDQREVVFSRVYKEVADCIPYGHGRALDLGSGNGIIVEILRSKGYQVTAVELDPDRCAALRERFPDVKVIQADLTDLESLGNKIEGFFSLATMIFTASLLDDSQLISLVHFLGMRADRLIMDANNSQSLYHHWMSWRKFPHTWKVYY